MESIELLISQLQGNTALDVESNLREMAAKVARLTFDGSQLSFSLTEGEFFESKLAWELGRKLDGLALEPTKGQIKRATQILKTESVDSGHLFPVRARGFIERAANTIAANYVFGLRDQNCFAKIYAAGDRLHLEQASMV